VYLSNGDKCKGDSHRNVKNKNSGYKVMNGGIVKYLLVRKHVFCSDGNRLRCYGGASLTPR